MEEKEKCKGCPERVPVSASPFTLLELLRRGVRVRKGNLLSVNSVGLGSSRAALWPG